MPKRSGKREDENQIAARILSGIQQRHSTAAFNEPVLEIGKNPAAVALGRLGGLKGGKARANKLSSKRRQQIARKAAPPGPLGEATLKKDTTVRRAR